MKSERSYRSFLLYNVREYLPHFIISMAKDYFQDIVPPPGGGSGRMRRLSVSPKSESEEVREEGTDIDSTSEEVAPTPDRSIRNVNFTPVRPRRTMETPPPPGNFGMPRKRRSRKLLWGIAAIAVVIVGGLLVVAMRTTTVTVTPRTHAVLFDDSSLFTAYPAIAAAPGSLPYTLETVGLEDSDTVASNGTVQASDKASGLITVFNDYSTSPQRLVKNTRFEAPGGIIFRAPSDIVVPGRTAAGPGQISVTVVADEAGEKYNVAPVSRFTLPGLKSTADMYAKIYAQSTTAFTGGFVGEKPGVATADMERAVAGIRSRLEGKARDAAEALSSESAVVFTDLVRISYEDLPATTESGGNVRVHQKATVSIPVFPAANFAKSVALSVSSDVDDVEVMLVQGEGFGARALSASSTLGIDPLQFGLVGAATIVWEVDKAALAEALAGRDQSAFQTIVTGFKGIQEARARIEPFWSGVFPKDPAGISIKVKNPTQ